MNLLRRGRAALLGLFVTVGACGPRDLEVLAGATDAGPQQPDGGPASERDTCAAAAPIDLCARVPRSDGDGAPIDGLPGALCEVPAMVVRADGAPWTRGTGVFPQVLTVRAAWSERGLHVHAHVEDPAVVVAAGDDIAQGDSLELYLAATGELTGPFDGVRDGGAYQVILAPPSGGLPARATVYLHPARAVETSEPLDPSRFAGRLVPGGYEIEALLPWRTGAPEAGATIGFDVGLNINDDPATPRRAFQFAIANLPVSGASNCTADVGPQPFCDDRTWCRPRID